MPRYFAAILTILLAAVIAAPASARIIEIGRTKATAAPSCTATVGDVCQVVTRTTGIQMRIGKIRDPHLITRPGRIVAFSVHLGKLTKSQIGFFTQTEYGPRANRQPGLGLGESSARISVLRAAFKTNNRHRFNLVAQSEDFKLADYFGRLAQFPLKSSIEVQKGDLLAITTPTWAPILAINVDRDTNWRGGREIPCANTEGEAVPQNAHLRTNTVKQYFCNYRTARLTYTATQIVTP